MRVSCLSNCVATVHCALCLSIAYQHFAANAVEDTEEEITISVYTTMELLDNATDLQVACLDAKWCTRSDGGCVLGRMMRCSDPNCLHPVVKRDRADGRGFFLVREQCRNSGLQKIFKPTVMIDKAAHERRALKSLDWPFLLCAFHM